MFQRFLYIIRLVTCLLLISTTSTTAQNELAAGHQYIRGILGTDIGQMDFNSLAAVEFRKFMCNSLLTSSTTDYYDGSVSSSTANILFCPDGTFAQSLSGYLGIRATNADAFSSGENVMPGYWEVAQLGERFVILFYSTHPMMLEDSPNGFLPFVVGQYSETAVLLPNGDGYRRLANQPCTKY